MEKLPTIGQLYDESRKALEALRDEIAPGCCAQAHATICSLNNGDSASETVCLVLIESDGSVHVSVDICDGNIPAALVKLTEAYHADKSAHENKASEAAESERLESEAAMAEKGVA